MFRSRMMRSGRSSRAARSASSPSTASETAYPDASSTARTSSRPPSLSSATSSRFIRLLCGDSESEPAPFANLTLDPNTAAVVFNQPLGNRQAKPRPLAYTFRGRAHLVELIENRRMLLAWNTDTRIAHRDLYLLLASEDINPNAAAFGCELYGIAEQVKEDLFETDRIGADGGRQIEGCLNFDGLGQPLRTNGRKSFFEHRADIDGFSTELQPYGFDLA